MWDDKAGGRGQRTVGQEKGILFLKGWSEKAFLLTPGCERPQQDPFPLGLHLARTHHVELD